MGGFDVKAFRKIMENCGGKMDLGEKVDLAKNCGKNDIGNTHISLEEAL